MHESSAAFALAPRSARSCAWIDVVEAPHAAIRSSSHSSMKAENWFQLRIVGVTIIARLRPGFFYRNQNSPAMQAGLMQSSLG